MSRFDNFSLESWNCLSRSEQQILLQHSKGGLLRLCQGDIAAAHTKSVGAVVNAANPPMYQGGGGTNMALSNVIKDDVWNKAAEDSGTLATGGVASCPWELKEGVEAANARYLIHALGPIVKDPKQFELAEGLVYRAYSGVFNLAQQLGLDSVQMPFLSTGIYAQALSPSARVEWKRIVDNTIYQTILEAFDRDFREVILLDHGQVPWSAKCF